MPKLKAKIGDLVIIPKLPNCPIMSVKEEHSDDTIRCIWFDENQAYRYVDLDRKQVTLLSNIHISF